MKLLKQYKKSGRLRAVYPLPADGDGDGLFGKFCRRLIECCEEYAEQLGRDDGAARLTLDYRHTADGGDRFVFTLTEYSGARRLSRRTLTFLWRDGVIAEMNCAERQA